VIVTVTKQPSAHHMKNLPRFAALAAVLPLAASLCLGAESLPPGQVDFGAFTPPEKGEFVEVNVPGSLISLASKFVQKEEPDVARLLNGIKLVRVNVIGLNDKNQPELQKRVESIRDSLTGKGWERIVTAQNQPQNVSVFLKMDADSAIQGLAVVVFEADKQAVFVNIVGDIKPEYLTTLGERLHIEPLKHLNIPEKEAK
jgi:hypothetical protein